MSNKRVAVRQEKQKKARNRSIAIASVCAAVLVIAGIFGFYFYDRYSKSYIMTYEGEKIGLPDYEFSVMSSMGAEDVKAEGLNQLLKSLTVVHQAEVDGIVLTEEEETELTEYTTNFRSLIGSTYGYDFSFISDDRLKVLLSSDVYTTHLIEKHTADYVVDEADFETQLADYLENSKGSYYDVGLKYIATETQEAMDEVVTNLETRPFDDVWKDFSIYYQEDAEITVSELKNMALPEDLTAEILGLTEAGSRTAPYQMTDGTFIIFEVVSYSIPGEETVRTNYRATYESQKEAEIFEGLLEGWVQEANYDLNQRAYDAYEA